MNIKTKYLIPLAIAAGMSVQSCSDFLDTEPAAIYSEDLVWGSEANINAFVIGKYSTVMGYYIEGQNQNNTEVLFTNNWVDARRGCPGYARGLMENTYNCGINDRFGIIRACNMIIERCSDSEQLSDNARRQYVALGKLMRAMVYYDLARKAGKFIWVDKVLSSDDPDFNLPLTKSVEESYKYILTDLREALPDLPESVKSGALSKDFGYAFTSEVLLTAAAYTGDAAALQNGKSLYQEAIDCVDQLKGYSLDPDYGGLFNQDGAYSSEIILAQYYDEQYSTCSSTGQVNLIANVVNSNLELNDCGPLWKTLPDIFECWMEICPTQNLVDAYLVVDQADGKAKKWNETSQWVNNTRILGQDAIFALVDYKNDDQAVIGYEVTSPDVDITDLMTEGRDARYDASILHDKSVFYGETIETFSHGNMTRWSGFNYGANHLPLTNYSMRKGIYTTMSPRPFYNVSTDYHRVVTRYGRALLNKAEAQLRLNRVSDAVATFNQTRTIHGKLPASTATTAAEAWADYKTERRVELFWEGDFYWSLLRWGKYGGDANDGKAPSSVINELTVPATFLEFNRERTAAYVGNVQFANDQRTFNVRSYLMPIPQSLINANSAISNSDQNPGWE